eukprot:TRINITY_DN6859_c0_g1_i4.p1 TRINITY_DN6859_c0_g1~~TRINITY_DN6859_c0_g1_i4.p1  ORF type:complete len:859 (+),score=265.24 TRINITY_DN6859_c0_g1_i4:439-3015(+)
MEDVEASVPPSRGPSAPPRHNYDDATQDFNDEGMDTSAPPPSRVPSAPSRHNYDDATQDFNDDSDDTVTTPVKTTPPARHDNYDDATQDDTNMDDLSPLPDTSKSPATITPPRSKHDIYNSQTQDQDHHTDPVAEANTSPHTTNTSTHVVQGQTGYDAPTLDPMEDTPPAPVAPRPTPTDAKPAPHKRGASSMIDASVYDNPTQDGDPVVDDATSDSTPPQGSRDADYDAPTPPTADDDAGGEVSASSRKATDTPPTTSPNNNKRQKTTPSHPSPSNAHIYEAATQEGDDEGTTSYPTPPQGPLDADFDAPTLDPLADFHPTSSSTRPSPTPTPYDDDAPTLEAYTPPQASGASSSHAKTASTHVFDVDTQDAYDDTDMTSTPSSRAPHETSTTFSDADFYTATLDADDVEPVDATPQPSSSFNRSSSYSFDPSPVKNNNKNNNNNHNNDNYDFNSATIPDDFNAATIPDEFHAADTNNYDAATIPDDFNAPTLSDDFNTATLPDEAHTVPFTPSTPPQETSQPPSRSTSSSSMSTTPSKPKRTNSATAATPPTPPVPSPSTLGRASSDLSDPPTPTARRRGRPPRSSSQTSSQTSEASSSQSSSLEVEDSDANAESTPSSSSKRRRTASTPKTPSTPSPSVASPSTPTSRGKGKQASPAGQPHGKVKVLFTGMGDKDVTQKSAIVRKLAGAVVKTAPECTHLVTDKVHRTAKFLGAISLGKHIVHVRWLEDCASQGEWADPEAFIIHDDKAEREYGFSLKRSLDSSRGASQPLLAGKSVYATPGVPSLQEIVQQAGGTYLAHQPLKFQENVLVFSCKEDAPHYKKLQNLGFTIHSKDFLPTAILRQSLDTKKEDIIA